ncbi:MAG: dihydrodipicolinate synthase family protein, partial [Nitrospinaceae bacterium]|nr:dihydrodipicolinate synthase family protein [Nitrospinaceae bacterium]
KEALALTQHAQDIGCDFAIILTPYIASNNDRSVLEFFHYIANRVDIGLVMFNSPGATYPISSELAGELVKIPNLCGMKQADLNPNTTLSILDAVGDAINVSVADETVWFHNMTQLGHRWLLTYTPHMYQVAGCLPIKEYTDYVFAGDVANAAKISASLGEIRKVNAKWILDPWRKGNMSQSAMKTWMELIGMAGGPVRPPVVELTDEEKESLRSDLERVGLIQKAKAGVS